MYPDLEHGLIYFNLFKAENVTAAYAEASKIIDEFANGTSKIEKHQLEAALSSLLFSIIGDEDTPTGAAASSLQVCSQHISFSSHVSSY